MRNKTNKTQKRTRKKAQEQDKSQTKRQEQDKRPEQEQRQDKTNKEVQVLYHASFVSALEGGGGGGAGYPALYHNLYLVLM